MLRQSTKAIKPFGRRENFIPANDVDSALGPQMNLAVQNEPTDDKDAKIAELEMRVRKAEIALQDAWKAADEAGKRADIDELTGLFNRARFMRELKNLHEANDNILATDRRRQGTDYLLMIDLDGFKMINDTYGHDAGDQALRVVADFLKSCVRESDIVARKGGDEFTVIMNSSNEETALQKMLQIIKGFETLKFDYQGTTIHVRGSVGACPIDPDKHPEAMMKVADDRMYQVKKEKGNTRFMLVKG